VMSAAGGVKFSTSAYAKPGIKAMKIKARSRIVISPKIKGVH
jgi:hypothetical protein